MEVKQLNQLGAYGKRILLEYQMVLFVKIAPGYKWDDVFLNVRFDEIPQNVNDFIDYVHNWIKNKENLPF